MTMSFADRLTGAIRRHGPLCVGLDPHPQKIPTLFGQGLPAIRSFFLEILQRIDGKSGIIKPQIALFERYGPAGLELLVELTNAAKQAGMVVLLDAKRGDIGSTAMGYAQAYLGPDAWLDVDAITLNPYMGMETLEPFFAEAAEQGKGAIVLVRTSNPGAADFQEQMIDGKPLYEHVAQKLAPFVLDMHLGQSDWSSLMVVVGATAPNEARRLRAILPRAPFLVPGFGAQGASASDALAASVNGEGVVVNASRSVLYPTGARRAKGFEDWAEIFDENLKQTTAELAQAL
ncbi:Orotidine 5'-phosphate decarboxylase [hydrothermal vent metagenome]|uniref:Orotidine 5'-phosphate decarboxylase n=1 Tax=hydrothermal vent metagenome TaxID=652676 RepID=A0A3B0RUL5_9ZZZZ